MRNEFGKLMSEIVEKDSKVHLLSLDGAYSSFKKFSENFPPKSLTWTMQNQTADLDLIWPLCSKL